MNRTALRLIGITAALAITSLGTVSVAQAKQGSDDAVTSSSSSSISGHGADDAVPHVSGADDAVPHVSGADDAVPHVSGADDAVPHVSGADDSVKPSASTTSSNHRQKGKHKRSSGHRGAHHTANHA